MCSGGHVRSDVLGAIDSWQKDQDQDLDASHRKFLEFIAQLKNGQKVVLIFAGQSASCDVMMLHLLRPVLKIHESDVAGLVRVSQENDWGPNGLALRANVLIPENQDDKRYRRKSLYHILLKLKSNLRTICVFPEVAHAKEGIPA